MSNEWNPKEELLSVIERTIEFISNDLAELQEAIGIGCPISFIVEIAHKVIFDYQTNQTIIIKNEE